MISITFSRPGPAMPWRALACAALLAALPAAALAQGQSREVSDQEHARSIRYQNQSASFEQLLKRAQSVGRGEYLGVEPDISRNIYRFKFMRSSGQVVWVDMDGRTGKVIAERM